MSKRRYYKELRVQQFRALVEVGRHSSFTAAANVLGLSRAAVWQQIHSLGEEFGDELVVTIGHQTELTADGKLLLELVGPLVEGFDSVKDVFQDRRGKLKRRLRVATTASLLNFELRKPLAHFRRKYPDVAVIIIERSSAAAIEMLKRGQADIAVTGRVEQIAANDSLKWEPFARYPFFAVCPKQHVLTKCKRFDLEKLIRYPLLIPSKGTNARQHIDAVFSLSGIEDRIDLAFDSQNISLLLSYVEAGMGIALSSMSPELVKQYSGNLNFRDVSERFGAEEVLVVQRQRRFELSQVKALIDILKKGNRLPDPTR